MAATTRTLSERELNRALLARQHLLRRSTASLPAMLESVGGLQMQYAPSGYIGCWSRLDGVTRSRVTQALERRQAVQATVMRATIHLVSAADFPVLFAATSSVRQREVLRRGRVDKLDADAYEALAGKVRGWFDADGPLERAELLDRLAAEGVGRDRWETLSQWLPMLRLPPQGTWERRRAHLYGLADHELDAIGPVDTDAAMEVLVERYLGGFGPARRDDLASWAGMNVSDLHHTLDRMTLRRFVDGQGAELIDLPRRPLPDASTPAPVRFLGTWDATLLVHARRTQILPEDYRYEVFSIRRPHSVNTVLVDGQVAGTWTIKRDSVVVEPFDGIPAPFRDELEEERAALEAFVT